MHPLIALGDMEDSIIGKMDVFFFLLSFFYVKTTKNMEIQGNLIFHSIATCLLTVLGSLKRQLSGDPLAAGKCSWVPNSQGFGFYSAENLSFFIFWVSFESNLGA